MAECAFLVTAGGQRDRVDEAVFETAYRKHSTTVIRLHDQTHTRSTTGPTPTDFIMDASEKPTGPALLAGSVIGPAIASKHANSWYSRVFNSASSNVGQGSVSPAIQLTKKAWNQRVLVDTYGPFSNISAMVRRSARSVRESHPPPVILSFIRVPSMFSYLLSATTTEYG